MRRLLDTAVRSIYSSHAERVAEGDFNAAIATLRNRMVAILLLGALAIGGLIGFAVVHASRQNHVVAAGRVSTTVQEPPATLVSSPAISSFCSAWTNFQGFVTSGYAQGIYLYSPTVGSDAYVAGQPFYGDWQQLQTDLTADNQSDVSGDLSDLSGACKVYGL